MIQGGDISQNLPSPSSALPFDIPKGGASIYHPDPLEQEIHTPTLRHAGRGVLSMAGKAVKGAVDPATGTPVKREVNGSQFFVTFVAAPHLDGNSTVFGRVLGLGDGGTAGDGGQTLTRLERAKVRVDKKGRVIQPAGGAEKDEEGYERIGIKNITIHANPLA